jgi:hypothetical protein
MQGRQTYSSDAKSFHECLEFVLHFVIFFLVYVNVEMVKRRSQTRQEAASTIFENSDIFQRIAGMSRNPNVRATNKTAAHSSVSDADKLGKRTSDDFEKQFHFVSNNEFNLAHTNSRNTITLKGDQKVDRGVFCKDVARIFQGKKREKRRCAQQCHRMTEAISASREIVIRHNVADFEMIEKFFTKLEPWVFRWSFKSPDTDSTFRPVLTKCALLSLGSIERIEYMQILFENTSSTLPEDVIQKILQYANQSWLGSHVKPKDFFEFMNSPKPNCVLLAENDMDTIFCKIFEPDEEGLIYFKYVKRTDDEYWTSVSYNTSDMLIKEMEQKLIELREDEFDIFWEATDPLFEEAT